MTDRNIVMFNPYTGKPRDPRDIASDPHGLLIIDSESPLYAAPQAVQGEPVLLNLALRLRLARRCLKQAISIGANQGYIDQLRGAETEAWNSFQAAKAIATPPADDEAVRLLRKARYMCDDSDTFTRMALAKAIDAYLAKAKK